MMNRHPSIQLKEALQHNEALLIDQVPDEVLSLIFALTIPSPWGLADFMIWEAVVEGETDDQTIRSVVNASHVCRRWREAAIGDPALWTFWSFFDLKRAAWFAELEVRSKGMPITLRTIQTETDIIDLRILPHSARIRQLEYIVCPAKPSKPPNPIQLLTYPCPSLESLAIPIAPSNFGNEVILPNPLFGGTATHLTELHLIESVPDLTNLAFKRVKRLRISRCSRLTSSELRRVGALADLEEVKFIGCHQYGPYDDGSVVELPQLRLLEIQGTIDQCKWYTLISCPPTCYVNILANVTRQRSIIQRQAIDELKDIFLDNLTRLAEPSHSFHWDISLKKHAFELSCHRDSRRSPFRLNIDMAEPTFNFLNPENFRQYTYPFLVTMKPLFESVNLFIGDSGCVHRELLDILPNTRHLVTEGERTVEAMIIYLDQSTPNSSPHEARFLPELRSWDIKGANLTSLTIRTQIVYVLTKRSAGSCPVEKIRIIECVNGEMLKRALELVRGLHIL